MLIECSDEGMDAAVDQIAADAWRRDGDPSFPDDALSALAAVGALGLFGQRCPALPQWAAVRSVSAADAVVGRIFERHLEAGEHLRHAPEPLRSDELDAVAAGERVLGVWDEDPRPGDGEPAELRDAGDGQLEIHGVKVHAVGAGGLDRAVIFARDAEGAPVTAYADVRGHYEVDRAWTLLGGHPPSAGDRVEIAGAPVIALLETFDRQRAAALRSRADLRRVAAWMGILGAITDAATEAMAERERVDDAEALAAGRMAAAGRTLELWLADAARHADADPAADLTALAAQTRAALAVLAGSVMEEAAVAINGGQATPDFARARRELLRLPGLERPDSALASVGRELLRRRRERLSD